jgi:ectoine hydroxylase-related dioxygenase (phytanoyl-CoA dioxygenase family)
MTPGEVIEENGFAILPGFFSPESVDRFAQEMSDLSPPRSRAGVRHALRFDPVAALAGDPRLASVACDVLGSKSFPFRATLFEKLPASNWLVVWHQDTALPLRERIDVRGWGPWSVKEQIDYAHAPAGVLSQILALRVHLDDSGTDNGPLRVLPRSHMLGVLSDEGIHDLAVRITPVDCVTAKGGVVAMRPLLVHASSKSKTEEPRRVLHIEYAATDLIADPLRLAIA